MVLLIKRGLLVLLAVFLAFAGRGQDNRTQYPKVLANSYFGVNFGYMDYNFNNSQLQPGYTAENIKIPHLGIRVIIGYSFMENLSAQISYMRPIEWVEYHKINGMNNERSVYMNVGGLTMKYRQPLSKKLSVFW